MSVTAPARYLADGWQETPATFDVISPHDGSLFRRAPDCGEAEGRAAIDRAWSAFETWRATNPFERSAILRRWFDAILARQSDIGRVMASEMGKPLRESVGEVAYAAGFVEWYAEEAKRAHGDWFAGHRAARRGLVMRQPVGPVYAVTPWNFRAAMVTPKAAPALAAGCTVILEPAEQTPFTALLLGELWVEAGGRPAPCRCCRHETRCR